MKTLYNKNNSSVKLLISLPLSDPQINQRISPPQKTFYLFCVRDPVPPPHPQPCSGLSVSQSVRKKALLVLSPPLISSPNTPTPRELPLPKSVSKSDYSCVSSGWEIWPMAYWHLTSDLSSLSLPLSCKWRAAAGSNSMSSIRFIKSYAEYIEVFPILPICLGATDKFHHTSETCLLSLFVLLMSISYD